MDKLIIQKRSHYFTDAEKHEIIQEYFSGKFTKREIWEKYTGMTEEHGGLLKWQNC
jgi:hypothetical protein